METQVSSVLFGVVAFLSVAGNFFLCVLLLRRKSMLKKTYNILILNLAATDIFGGETMTNNSTFGHCEPPSSEEITSESIVYMAIAPLSILGNSVLVFVILRHNSLLTKTYNIIILNLALTNLLQGIFLFLTPNYVFQLNSYPKMSGIGGEVFCRTVFSTYFLFVCGKASNASVMCLAIERWYAVVRPTKYKSKFGRRRLYTYIALIWISASITEIFELFIAKMVDGSCQWITPPYGATAESAFLVLHVTVTFYIPSVVTWASFAHIWFRMASNNAVGRQNQSTNAKKNVVPMCALAAFFLTVLWFPTETFWVLRKFKVVILPHLYYLVFNLLAFLSSCINPFIYCLSNKTYRREVVSLIDRLRCCDRGSTRVVPFESHTVSATNDLQLRTVNSKITVISEEDRSVIPLSHMKDMYTLDLPA